MTVIESSVNAGLKHNDLPPPPMAACEECGGQLLEDDHNGQVVCPTCGVVQQDYLLVHQVRRGGTWEELQARVCHGGPISLGAATYIGMPRQTLTDYQGKRLDNPKQWQALRRWNSQILRYNSRSEILGDYEAGRMCAHLDLPLATWRAATALFLRYYRHEGITGYSIRETVAGTIYVTCRQQHVACAWQDLVQAAGSGITQTIIYRAVARICQAFHLHLLPDANRVVSHLERICNTLNLSPPVRQSAITIAMKARLRQGFDPCGIAAAIIYLSCKQAGDKVAQAVIAQSAGVTEVTLRARARMVQSLFPNVISNKSPEWMKNP